MSLRATTGESRHPALRHHEERRRAQLQNRIADGITAFAGSMPFVYVHIVWFALWIGLGVEKYPFGLLTMIVSLEAIFLSTFVMISQNRADAKRQVLADQQWEFVRTEETQNEQLLALSAEILDLTKAIHAMASRFPGGGAGDPPSPREGADPASGGGPGRTPGGRPGGAQGGGDASAP
jgi:uncharacterized membrane protein